MGAEWFGRNRDGILAVVLALACLAVAGCSPSIGDHCVLNTDCASDGTLQCDTSLPNGYCTQFNCTTNSCQNSAACVAFEPSVPGCPYDDYRSPARTTRTFCMAHCQSTSDCRSSEGYICADPRDPPWNAAIIDDYPQKVCLPGYSAPPGDAATTLPEGSVCLSSGPLFEAGEPSSPDAAPSEGGEGGDAGEGGATPDAPGTDANHDAGADDGAPDAQDEG